MTWLFATGCGLLLAAALIDLVAGVRARALVPVPYLLDSLGCLALCVTGGRALAGHTTRIGLDHLLGLGNAGLAIDPLSGLFLTIAFGVAVPVSLGFASWAREPRPRQPVRLGESPVVGHSQLGTLPDEVGARISRRGLAATTSLTLGAVAIIITARSVFAFLFAWESLTIAFYLFAGFDRHRVGRANAAVITFIFGKISGAALLIGFLLLAARSHSFDLAAYAHVPPGTVHAAAYALLVLGFGVKIGLVPVQVWLPRAYAAAPGPARAIMAGVAVNVGFYGLWRTIALLGAPPSWLAGLVLVVAACTAVLGIAHAAVHRSLQHVIAYSSVENAGLILAGYGVALVGAATHMPRLVAVGLLAGTLQVIAHAAAKSLLFTTSAGIESAAGTDELDALRGAARRTPWSGTGFAIGAITLAGLPPTVGFVSEWFLLESLMQQFRVPGLAFRLCLAVAGAAVALTAGFAGVTFVRLVGLMVLGHAPDTTPRRTDVEPIGRAAITLLSLACLAVAAFTPIEIHRIGSGLAPAVASATTAGAQQSPWVVQPVYAEFSALSPSWLWVMMPLLLVATYLLFLLLSGGRLRHVRRVPAWRSATAGVEGADQYSAFGYANPARKVLANVLLTRSELHRIETSDAADSPGERLSYRSDVVELVERVLYRPLLRPAMALVHAAKRLQSGRLDAYLTYMLIALVAVLALVTALV